jgi:hypothetical protein
MCAAVCEVGTDVAACEARRGLHLLVLFLMSVPLFFFRKKNIFIRKTKRRE